MRSRDYTQEIGVSHSKQQVSVTVGFIVLSLVIVAAIWFMREVQASGPAHAQAAEQPATAKVAQR